MQYMLLDAIVDREYAILISLSILWIGYCDLDCSWLQDD